MRFGMGWLRFLLTSVFAAGILTGCAREDQQLFNVRLKVSLAEKTDERSLSSTRLLGVPLWGTPGEAPPRWPTYFEDFNCIGVNVMGPGIAPSAAAPNRATMDEILNGSRCSYPGVLSDLVPIPAGASTTLDLKLRIPAGPDRLVQIIGVVNDGSGCPTASNVAGSFSSMYGVYELVRQRVDFKQEGQTLSLRALYSESMAKEIRCEASVSPSAYCALPTRTSGNYAAGDGTRAPYEICSERQLREFSSRTSDYGSKLKLRSSVAVVAGASPPLTAIGTSGTPFTGDFDGNGQAIVFSRSTSSPITGEGLFGSVGDGVGSAFVRNLRVSGTVVGTGAESVGILAGQVQFGSSISSCAVAGSVSARNSVGGLVGFAGGTISASSSTATVRCSSTFCGGLAGYNTGNITGSLATGNVISENVSVAQAGGFVGFVGGGTVTRSAATGTVTAVGDQVGGFVGGIGNSGSVTEVFATGAVSGRDIVGGLIGLLDTSTSGIADSYSTGNVTGDTRAGGILGFRQSTGMFSRLYTTLSTLTANTNWGAVIGHANLVPAPTCFSLAGVTASGFGYENPRTQAQMHTAANYTAQSWDFSVTGPWSIDEGRAYPVLRNYVAPTIFQGP